MVDESLEAQLRRLLLGLTDQEIKGGKDFFYDGGRLYADECADILLPSVLCLSQHLASRVGMHDFGYRFEIGSLNPVFPLVMQRNATVPIRFLQVAPFVAEVFETDVLNCRHDLARLFELAAKLVQPGFTLEVNTNYKVPKAARIYEPPIAVLPSLEG